MKAVKAKISSMQLIFLIIALILSIMYALNINIPSPMRGLQYIYEKILM